MNAIGRMFVSVIALAVLVSACGDSTSTSGTTSTPEPTVPSPGTIDPALATRPADGVDTYAIADLSVTIAHPEHDDVAYTLSCFGDTATTDDEALAVSPDLACKALLDPSVVARLIDGPPADRACTEIYGGPDVAVISGTLGGTAVNATIDRTNGCGISDWDDLLVDVLPMANGIAT